MSTFPHLAQVVLDTTDARRLAEFYREFLGYRYRPGDESPPPGADDHRGRDWLVLLGPDGARAMAFQQVERPPGQRRLVDRVVDGDPADLVRPAPAGAAQTSSSSVHPRSSRTRCRLACGRMVIDRTLPATGDRP